MFIHQHFSVNMFSYNHGTTDFCHLLTKPIRAYSQCTGVHKVFKNQVAFDALLDALGVKIERRYFLTIPKYTYTSV